jgi:pSer/pThr/pTyr-binding forkhead associated (FHA) protein
MPKQRLVINSDDASQFFLLIEGDTITVGRPGTELASVLAKLRVAHVHCVLDVEGEQVTLRNDEPDAPGTAQEVRAGAVLRAGIAQLCLQVEPPPAPLTGGDDEPSLLPVDEQLEAAESAAATTQSPQQGAREKRLFVVDGADQGQTFMLPDSGTIVIGKDRKFADIILHDFYTAKSHCRLKVLADKVEVVDDDAHGAQINGKNVRRHEMVAGEVLRIGNTHLRLEMTEPGQKFAKPERPAPVAAEEEPVELTVEEAGFEEVEDDEEEIESPPADAPEPVRLLHVWREKLAQLSGQTFGHYKLGAVLGRGRAGVVFEAEDAKNGQVVALKVFSPQFPQGNQELQRFTAVMKRILPLRHPNLVALLGAGKTATYTWLAREHVKGESAARVIRRIANGAKPDAMRAYRVAVHIGRALEFARQQRMCHGKVAPANVLLRADGKGAKLADLMLGAVLEGSQLGQAVTDYRPTAELAYLSPEQADPDAFVDELSDIYGLGAVVYALLTGRPPFVGETAEEVVEQLRGSAKVPRLSTINSAVPAPLEKVVMKMLARRQEDRYQAPADLLAALEPIADALETEEDE